MKSWIVLILLLASCGGNNQNPHERQEQETIPHVGLNVMRIVIAGDQSPSLKLMVIR